MATVSLFSVSFISTGIAALLVMTAILLMIPETRQSTISTFAQINRTLALACGRLFVAFLWPFIAFLNFMWPAEEPYHRPGPRPRKYSRQGSMVVRPGTRTSTSHASHAGRRVRFRLVREKSYPPVFSDTEED